MAKKKKKKRPYGFGTVYQRESDGRWVASLSSGKGQKPTIKYAKTEKEAESELEKIRDELIRNGTLRDNSDILNKSIKSLMENWLNDFMKTSMAPTSFDRLEFTANKYVLPYLEYIQLQKLTKNDIQKMINSLHKKGGFSASTIKKAYNCINALLKWTGIPVNPALGVKIPNAKSDPKLKPKEIYIFSKVEIKSYTEEAIRKHSNNQYVYRLGYGLVLILNTGMRRSEALGLTWDNVNFEKKSISICRAVVNVRNRDSETPRYILRVQDTKTKSSERTIPLNKQAMEAIIELQKINGDKEYVFSNRNGFIESPRALNTTHEDICRSIGIKKGGIHTLRHTFASMLFDNNVKIAMISRLLGHAKISTTYNIYVHLIPDEEEKMIEAVDFKY